MKKLLIATLLATALPLAASAAVIIVREAPPPPRHEHVPAARPGYAWTPGYWQWSGHRYTWHRGEYVRTRAGQRWNAPAWHERNGRWEFERGGWRAGDRDHDGVANRHDRDRDGDGVPNRHDDRPDNPRRH
ncbi:thrombospondin type 3 repeat-containing protein [Pseudoduganella armeniaca]|uniref:BcpO-related WXXGXW repeat protein n=1 Tax=Pseudoduganella armeniaca TaxID=2072590 RepID=A0A2R4CAL1_9BURK|nr:thrombospondin type 3 repeat-containing protein [Pseudoduganella armeniaca]AVR96538.1 hypothetical protein C9I28_13160 [Pseudoduganella armeniaca]